MYQIIAIKNRLLKNIHSAGTLDDAVKLANALMEEQWLAHDPDDDDDWTEPATAAYAHASCNVRDDKWDAYVVRLSSEFGNLR